MNHSTELTLKILPNLPATPSYDAIRDVMDEAPLRQSNETTAKEYMTTYRYALWPVSEHEAGRIMVEIQEPESTVVDENNLTVYDFSPVVSKVEAVRSFSGLFASSLDLVLSGLGYKLDKVEEQVTRRTLITIDLPSLKTLTERADNGVEFISGNPPDYTTVTKVNIDQTKILAGGKISLGGNDETVAERMIWSAPFAAMLPKEFMTGLIAMSQSVAESEPSHDFDRQMAAGQPARILGNFMLGSSVVALLKDALKNEDGISGVSYSPIDQLGFEMNSLAMQGSGELVDHGKSLAAAMIAHIRQIETGK